MNYQDLLWKDIIEDLFLHFFDFFYPDHKDRIDIERGFEFLDKELSQISASINGGSAVFVDKLIKAYTHDGEDRYLIVHIEVQGYPDKNFAERMLSYCIRIYDRYGSLPEALAILTDKSPTFRPSKIELMALESSLLYNYKIYKILDQDEKELQASQNPFALVMRMVLIGLKKGYKIDKELLEKKEAMAEAIFNRRLPDPIKNILYRFLKAYISFNDKRNREIFEEKIAKLSHQNKPTMGVIETAKLIEAEDYKEIGRLNEADIVIRNLIAKFNLSSKEISEIVKFPVKYVKEYREKMNI